MNSGEVREPRRSTGNKYGAQGTHEKHRKHRRSPGKNTGEAQGTQEELREHRWSPGNTEEAGSMLEVK